MRTSCLGLSTFFQCAILFKWAFYETSTLGNKFCHLKTLPRSTMSTKKQHIIGVGNLDIPGYQDSPPQDCPLGRQSWGGESWGYSINIFDQLEYVTLAKCSSGLSILWLQVNILITKKYQSNVKKNWKATTKVYFFYELFYLFAFFAFSWIMTFLRLNSFP